jgi:hypothetical protein
MADVQQDTTVRNYNQARRKSPCIVCDKPVNTSIVVKGSAEWQTAALAHLGLPEQESRDLVRYVFEQQLKEAAGELPIVITSDNYLVWPNQVGEGMTIRVCRDCAAQVGWTASTVHKPRTFLDQAAYDARAERKDGASDE